MELLNITWRRMLNGFIKDSTYYVGVDMANITYTTGTTMFYNNAWNQAV